MEMPHPRNRHLLNLLIKRQKLWPVLGVLGPRQVGKSTLLRDQLAPEIGAEYVTLDLPEQRRRASRAPGNFVRTVSHDLAVPVVIDEVQKAGELFDAIKAAIDPKRIPGRFFLSGSTEFSTKSGIRESLTGRIGVTRLYPFTLAEVRGDRPRIPWVNGRGLPLGQSLGLEQWLDRGGMPGICFLRDEAERTASYESWLETTCFRDLQQIRESRLEGELARDILYQLAVLERPTLAEASRKLNQDARKVRKHIEALEALFVIQRMPPHPLGIGKDHFLVFDAGLGKFLGMPRRERLRVWALNECLAQYEYSGLGRPKVAYYQSSKHSFIDMVVKDRKGERAFVITEDASPSTYCMRSLEAFQKKAPQVFGTVLAPVHSPFSESKKLKVVPWIAMG